jgi:hypothetical protein
MTFHNSIAPFLRSGDSVIPLFDDQLFNLTNPGSHELHSVVKTATALPKVFNIPGIPINALHPRSGWIFSPINNVFIDPLIGRTLTNTWQDPKVRTR